MPATETLGYKELDIFTTWSFTEKACQPCCRSALAIQNSPRTSSPASPGNMLELQILRLHPRPAESESAFLTTKKGLKWLLCTLNLRSSVLGLSLRIEFYLYFLMELYATRPGWQMDMMIFGTLQIFSSLHPFFSTSPHPSCSLSFSPALTYLFIFAWKY